MDVMPRDAPRSSDPMDLRRLAQFVAAADSGSLTSAARSLFITQQAMSSAMRQLEKELGVALFARQGRRVVLTPAGHKLREGAPALLAASAALAAAARRAAEEAAPAFVIAHTPAITSDEALRSDRTDRTGSTGRVDHRSTNVPERDRSRADRTHHRRRSTPRRHHTTRPRRRSPSLLHPASRRRRFPPTRRSGSDQSQEHLRMDVDGVGTSRPLVLHRLPCSSLSPSRIRT